MTWSIRRVGFVLSEDPLPAGAKLYHSKEEEETFSICGTQAKVNMTLETSSVLRQEFMELLVNPCASRSIREDVASFSVAVRRANILLGPTYVPVNKEIKELIFY